MEEEIQTQGREKGLMQVLSGKLSSNEVVTYLMGRLNAFRDHLTGAVSFSSEKKVKHWEHTGDYHRTSTSYYNEFFGISTLPVSLYYDNYWDNLVRHKAGSVGLATGGEGEFQIYERFSSHNPYSWNVYGLDFIEYVPINWIFTEKRGLVLRREFEIGRVNSGWRINNENRGFFPLKKGILDSYAEFTIGNKGRFETITDLVRFVDSLSTKGGRK